MKLATALCFGILLMVGSAGAAQQLGPQSNPPCGAATAKICSVVDWSQFHFDPEHTGFNPYETILSPATVGNLVLDWQYQAPPYFEYFETSPAVVDGEVFFTGVGWGNVYAVDARTAVTRWIWSDNDIVMGSPAVAYGKVYVADPNGQRVQVLDQDNGHLFGSWGHDMAGDVTVANDAIYVATAHMGYVHYGDVIAFDANTGETLWDSFMQSGRATSPAVANGRVYVACTPDAETPENLCAMDAATGGILWQFSPEGVEAFFQPAVSKGVVYVGASINGLSFVYALDAVTEGVLWRRWLPVPGLSENPRLTTPAVANGIVYIGTADYSNNYYGYEYAIDAYTGTILWKYGTPGNILSSAAVANGVVYFGSDDKNIYALDASTGALLWKYATGGKVISSPAVVNGMLFVGSDDLYMYAFHLPGQ